MPPFIAAMLIGAGTYASIRAVQRLLASLTSVGESAAGSEGQPSAAPIVVKDLGRLEFDATTGAYRPSRPHRSKS